MPKIKLDENLFEALMDSLQEGVYFVDTERMIQYWNRGAEQLTGYARKEVVGRCCASNILAHIDNKGVSLCTGDCPLKYCILDGRPRCSEVYLHHKDGHRLPVLVRTSAIRDATGRIIGALESFTDNTSKVSAFERIAELEAQALMCPLTLIGNRRYAEQYIRERLEEGRRYHKQCGLIFLDIDHFKQLNDRFGHAIGDLVLKMVANTLRSDLRSFDFVARWGGEEFVALVQVKEAAELMEIAERMRILVFNTSRLVSKSHIQVTVSVGATLAKDSDTLASFVERADRFMYISKKSGRNIVTSDEEAARL